MCIGRSGSVVVGRLRHVDVIVGVDRLLRPHLPATEFDGAIGDDLVRVHVGLCAAARLPDVQREVIVELSVGHLGRGAARSGRPARGPKLGHPGHG